MRFGCLASVRIRVEPASTCWGDKDEVDSLFLSVLCLPRKPDSPGPVDETIRVGGSLPSVNLPREVDVGGCLDRTPAAVPIDGHTSQVAEATYVAPLLDLSNPRKDPTGISRRQAKLGRCFRCCGRGAIRTGCCVGTDDEFVDAEFKILA